MLLLLDSSFATRGSSCCCVLHDSDKSLVPAMLLGPEWFAGAKSPVFMRVPGTYRISPSAFMGLLSMGFIGFPQVFCGFLRFLSRIRHNSGDFGVFSPLLRASRTSASAIFLEEKWR
jgi:hypothetical protein